MNILTTEEITDYIDCGMHIIDDAIDDDLRTDEVVKAIEEAEKYLIAKLT